MKLKIKAERMGELEKMGFDNNPVSEYYRYNIDDEYLWVDKTTREISMTSPLYLCDFSHCKRVVNRLKKPIWWRCAMISEERLKDIIQNKGTVWCIDKGTRPYRAAPVIFERDEEIGASKFIMAWGKKNIFETKEEATEYLKYGNVTRTEKLELPTWKEIQTILNKQEIVEGYFNYVKHFPKPNNLNGEKVISIYIAQEKILIDDDDRDETVFAEDFTKENWDRARDICVKLFKGEEV